MQTHRMRLWAFIDALEQPYGYIGKHPTTGSSRYAGELNLPGLRCWPLKRSPHLIFYLEQSDHIDVWRVLRGKTPHPSMDARGRSLAQT